MSYICTLPDASMIGTFVDDGRGNNLGDCVSLPKHQCSNIPATSSWRRGQLVKSALNLARGTAIATFNEHSKFVSGHGHAAIFFSKSTAGILVYDQYKHPPKKVGLRTLPFDDTHSNSNNGNKFYIID